MSNPGVGRILLHNTKIVPTLGEKIYRWRKSGGEGRRRGRQRMRWLDGITDSMYMSLVNWGSWWWTGRPGVLQSMGSQRVRQDWATELNWTENQEKILQVICNQWNAMRWHLIRLWQDTVLCSWEQRSESDTKCWLKTWFADNESNTAWWVCTQMQPLW